MVVAVLSQSFMLIHYLQSRLKLFPGMLTKCDVEFVTYFRLSPSQSNQ